MGVDARIQFTTYRVLTDRELADLRYRIYDCFGDSLMIIRFGHAKYGPIERHCIDEVEQRRYKVHLTGRYYNVGYERGDWPTLDGIMQWLALQPSVAKVFYGDDCSDEFVSHKDCREALWQHFANHGRQPYLFGASPHRRATGECPDCGGATWNSGWSRDNSMYQCPGCGWSMWNLPEFASCPLAPK